jgi:hypothetical protein
MWFRNCVEETELTKVKDIIKESFNIEDDIIIQRFDKIWEEFIDINGTCFVPT